MAISLQDIIQDTASIYRIRILAGKQHMNRVVSWVHLVEDTTVTDYFWGNELVITTGICASDPDWLLTLIRILQKRHCCGLIVNIGKYVMELPQTVIDFCREQDFPLFTVPWEVFITEMIKDYCMRIFNSERNEEFISKAFQDAILSPNNTDAYLPILENTYQLEEDFQVVLFQVQMDSVLPGVLKRQAELIVRNTLARHPSPYGFFRYQHLYVLVFHKTLPEQVLKLTQTLLERYQSYSYAKGVFMGIGTPVQGAKRIAESYRRARAALSMSLFQKKNLTTFEEMGVYKILFAVEDRSIMTDFYEELLGPLIAYDNAHHSNYLLTLFHYLRTDGSIQAVSDATYTHRNTINYRLRKIRELLNCPLETASERFPYQMAFYIKGILSL